MKERRISVWMVMLVGLLWGCMIGTPDPTRTPLPVVIADDPRPTPTIFTAVRLPPMTPLSQAEHRRCPRAPRTRLIISARARVTNNDQALNIRSNPGTQYQQIGQMPPGAIFFVMGGPRCEGEYA